VDHAVESILWPGSHPFSDTLALEGLKRLQRGLLAACADPGDLDARTEGQLGAWFSFTYPAAAGGLSHTLGKRIGATHGIPHGVTSCLLLPGVLRRIGPAHPEAMKRLSEALGPSPADAIASLVERLGLPRRLSAFGVGERDLREAARPLAGKPLDEDELLAILRAAL
jgi:alcohol dehydrogenase class IV